MEIVEEFRWVCILWVFFVEGRGFNFSLFFYILLLFSWSDFCYLGYLLLIFKNVFFIWIFFFIVFFVVDSWFVCDGMILDFCSNFFLFFLFFDVLNWGVFELFFLFRNRCFGVLNVFGVLVICWNCNIFEIFNFWILVLLGFLFVFFRSFLVVNVLNVFLLFFFESFLKLNFGNIGFFFLILK